MSDTETEKKKGGIGKKAGIGCLALVAVFVVIGVIGGGNDAAAPEAGTGNAVTASSAAAGAVPGATGVAENAQASALTRPQQNAVRTARQYLSFAGFSKDGLIDQLSSDAGDGYSVADATAAVESLNIDWNAQAESAAKKYLSISGFSCRGLIEQLSSDAGDKFTVEQATYGARQAGAC